MKRLATLTVLIWILAAPLPGCASRLFVKLSIYDCQTSTGSLKELFGHYSDASIVMSEEFAADSSGIFEKFGLGPYARKILWSTPLYDSLSRSRFSEIVQYCNSLEVKRVLLKGSGSFRPAPCGDGQSATGCSYKTPTRMKLKDYRRCTVIENYVTDEKFVFDKARQTLRKIAVSDSQVRALYWQLFHDTRIYETYRTQAAEDSRIRPKVTTAFFSNDTVLMYTVLTYGAASTRPEDSASYGKMLTLAVENPGRPASFFPLQTKSDMAGFGVNEFHLFAYQNQLYAGLVGNLRSPELKTGNPPVIARYPSLQPGLRPQAVPGIGLSHYCTDYGIGYNYSNLVVSGRYLGLPMSDYYIDLKDNSKHRLPLPDSVFERNKNVMSTQDVGYCLNDLQFNPEANLITILYELDHATYVSSFRPGSERLQSTTCLFPMSAYRTRLKSTCLSYDGTRLRYVRAGADCFEECPFETCKSQFAE